MFCLAQASKRLRNSVVIVSDDQGYADVSYSPHSQPAVKMPQIEDLAESGVVCKSGYASGYVLAGDGYVHAIR